jgi:sulfite exporter TauE/SafE
VLLSSTSISKIFFTFAKKLPPSIAQFFVGVGNGLLPCGLVYSALGASLLAPTPVGSGIFMLFLVWRRYLHC